MKKLLFLCLVSTGFAVLPPFYQSTKEFHTLLNHPRFVQLLGRSEDALMSITRTETGYQVLTRNYMMEVDIHYGGDERIVGPAQFQFEFFEPIDLRVGGTARIPAN